ncbi:hypothetical protein LJC10_02245 [Selenomonadales bacterium OttesenSCG-928-I06]|nr:hypothetical protein [Selenomonadales bacterium OttesenSCG-928-I06]
MFDKDDAYRSCSYLGCSSKSYREVTFCKIDGRSKRRLPGAVFELTSKDGAVKRAVSDYKGRVTFCIVPYERYALTEVEPPNGYSPNSFTYYITVSSSGKLYVNGVCTSQLFIPNVIDRENFRFTINKIDSVTGAPLAGGEFTLYQNGSIVSTVVSNVNGGALFTDLKPGVYTMIETQSPYGYQRNPTVYTVVVDAFGKVTINGQTAQGFTVTNAEELPPRPNINIVTRITSVVTGTGVPGCVVTVTFADGATVDGVVGSDENWSVIVPEGTTLVAGQTVAAYQTCDGISSEVNTVTVLPTPQ